MAAQSKVSLFLAALKTLLAGAGAGDGGWYTPRVVRAPAFEERWLDPTVDEQTIYFLVPGTVAPQVKTFGAGTATILAEVRVDLLVARRYEGGDDPFNPPSPDRWEEQDRITQDVTKRLLGDRSVGGTCLNVAITDVEQSADQTFHETWAVAFLSLLATVEYTVAAP